MRFKWVPYKGVSLYFTSVSQKQYPFVRQFYSLSIFKAQSDSTKKAITLSGGTGLFLLNLKFCTRGHFLTTNIAQQI